MSGYSETRTCPRCGIESCVHWEDRDDMGGYCLECGHEYHLVYSVMSLEDVNQERVACGCELITELAPHVEGWKDD